jgi:hypothetical protein
MPDLWPEIGTPSIRTPVSILREQASLLGTKTNNVVEGEVKVIEGSMSWAISWDFGYVFYLVAPLLKNYRYRLLSIAHRLDMYPLRVRLSEEIAAEIILAEPSLIFNTSGVVEVGDEDTFLVLLSLVLRSSKTIKVIHALIAQSQT